MVYGDDVCMYSELFIGLLRALVWGFRVAGSRWPPVPQHYITIHPSSAEKTSLKTTPFKRSMLELLGAGPQWHTDVVADAGLETQLADVWYSQ